MVNADHSIEVIHADWPAPDNVHAFTTTRRGGVSHAPYRGLNLATHVGDKPHHVQQNRQRLRQQLKLPAEPLWLSQCHTDRVIQLIDDARSDRPAPTADAAFSCEPNRVCAVLTADCLPLLICNREGSRVAAIHAGWKGLYAGIISNTLKQLDCRAEDLLVWLGPAISAQAFEVGADVYTAFCETNPANEDAFCRQDANHWLCDLYQLARLELRAHGIAAIHGGEYCTCNDAARFYSYRRDGVTGRMASLIWC